MQIYVQPLKSYYNLINNNCEHASKIKLGTSKPKEHIIYKNSVYYNNSAMRQPKTRLVKCRVTLQDYKNCQRSWIIRGGIQDTIRKKQNHMLSLKRDQD